MAANDDRTYIVPSLLKLAYHAYNKIQQDIFDELDGLDVDLQLCCESIYRIIRQNTESENFDSFDNRQFMYDKVQNNYAYDVSIKTICERAAHYGHIDCLMFAREIGVPWCDYEEYGQSACLQAAAFGDLDCLVYSHENGSLWDELMCKGAAIGGHIECLIYARENGCPWNTDILCSFAATNEHLNCLWYARETGYQWDLHNMCSYAAMSGHLECLQYTHEQGYMF